MFAKIARGAFLLMLAVMVASWAMTISKSEPLVPEPVNFTIYA
jgi:hypothetical protein